MWNVKLKTLDYFLRHFHDLVYLDLPSLNCPMVPNTIKLVKLKPYNPNLSDVKHCAEDFELLCVSTPMICGIWVQFPPTPLVPITLNWFESALRLPLHLI